MTRLAIITELCSGQRIGDCIRMQYGWITAGIMEFTQEKIRKGGVTKDVAVPMHFLWIEELAKLPKKSVTLPFISYGGSSMIALSIGMGLLLAFTRRNPYLSRSPYGPQRWSGAK